jgi:hypothetical protein
MEIDSCLEDGLSAYAMLFHRHRFGFASKFNLECLRYFSIPNQERWGKIDVRLNITALQRLPHCCGLHYLVMTEYQEILPLMYLLRAQGGSCQVVTTKCML